MNNTSTIVNGSIVGYDWNFGDQTTSTQTILSIFTHQAEFISTTLVATSDRGCIDSLTLPVRAWWLPQPLLQADVVEGCEPLPVSFVDLSTSQDGSVVELELGFGKW
ncbi:MAG: hypothetical protein IPO63_04715 [Bacteroidetes bacterium]|nr:hypothetical protein [Bacteroidota bacterium]